MHHLPRPGLYGASPATNPTTNPERTNNSRDRPPSRSRSSQDLTPYLARAQQENAALDAAQQQSGLSGLDNESRKLNQIVQNFYTKAALVICSARANLPNVELPDGSQKMNRWFNLVLEDTNVLADELRPWKRANVYERKPQSLVIETYIDTSYLSYNQALVIVDDAGRRYDVAGALGSSSELDQHSSTRSTDRPPEVVIERWTIELGNKDDYRPSDLNDALPNVYKKGVVVFRALYTMSRSLPAWQLHKRLSRQPGSPQGLRLRFRIRQGTGHVRDDRDTLYAPLCPAEQSSRSALETYSTAPLLCSAGPLSISVDYRSNCEFYVDDAEAHLSYRLLAADGRPPVAQPGQSLPANARIEQPRVYPGSSLNPVTEPRYGVGAYGSLGTFHGVPEKRGSPMTELKQRMLDDEASYEDVEHARNMPDARIFRRPSVSLVTNPPFKAGSLASSPRSGGGFSTSAGRAESYFAKVAGTSATYGTSASKRISLNTLPQQALRAPSLPNETAIASSGSASPKPAPVHRYSSSFAGRTKRFSQQNSKITESNVSSGRESQNSSKERSGQLNEIPPGSAGSHGASGIGATAKSGDEDDIAAFISQIEGVKDLPSFRSRPTSSRGDNNAAMTTTVNLAKYTNRRDPNLQLAEEMGSSSLFQASVTPPSRRLSNVPALSTSSPSSHVYPHMPHGRSRLSTQSIIDEVGARASLRSTGAGVGGSNAGGSTGGGAASGASGEGLESPRLRDAEEQEEDEEPFIFAQDSI